MTFLLIALAFVVGAIAAALWGREARRRTFAAGWWACYLKGISAKRDTPGRRIEYMEWLSTHLSCWAMYGGDTAFQYITQDLSEREESFPSALPREYERSARTVELQLKGS